MSMPNPSTTTRRDFTAFQVEKPCPQDAAPEYQRLFTDLQELLDLLSKNEAMEPNLEQTYSTPANRKSKVYFMWDFVGRTLGMLSGVPPSLDGSRSAWNEVQGRIGIPKFIVSDSSMQAMIMGGAADSIEFGHEIEGLVRGLGTS